MENIHAVAQAGIACFTELTDGSGNKMVPATPEPHDNQIMIRINFHVFLICLLLYINILYHVIYGFCFHSPLLK